MGKIDLFNELFIVFISLHIFVFTDYVLDPELQFKFGFSMISLTVINFVSNLVMLFSTAFTEAKRDLLMKYRKRNYDNMLK